MKNFLGLLLALFVVAPSAYADFIDVTWDNINRESILYLQQNGIVSGYPDGSFGFDKDINRAEILKILIESNLQIKGETQAVLGGFANNCFEDVASGDWFAPYVCYAKNEGWINGYDGGRFFRPYQSVSLVEAAKMALVTYGFDYNQTDRWYKGVIDKASELNILPIDVEYFHHSLTRGQMANLVVRTIKYFDGSLEQFLGDYAQSNVSFDTLKVRDNLYNSTLEECKVPSINRMISQTRFNFQDGSQECLTIVKIYTNSLDDLPLNFGLTQFSQKDYYTAFYKTNINDSNLLESLLTSIVDYSDGIMDSYEMEANKSQYRSQNGIFYVNFPNMKSQFTVVEYPLIYPRPSEPLPFEQQQAAWRMEAEDRFDISSCKAYNFPSFMLGKIKTFYEYCKEIGFRN